MSGLIYASGTANKFDADNMLPNGHASSDTDLIISGTRGEHWTFVTNDAPNHPTFRVENTFADADHIHFEMFSTKGRRQDVDQGE